jgi:hypothetical protein
MFTTILLGLATAIAVVLIAGIFMKKTHYVKREIVIHAPLDTVFNFLKLLKNQEQFNKWAQADPNRNWEFKGTDGTVGFVIAWSGNKKAGEGEKEIMNIVDGKRIETEIRFVKPMKMTAQVIMETEAISENQTKVAFINTGIINYPLNIFIPMAEKNFPKDLDASLLTLKKLLEQ